MTPKVLRFLSTVLAIVAGPVTAPTPVWADVYPPQAPILRLELGMHSAAEWQVGTDSSGRFVITASDDKTARLWDASDGQLLRIFRVPSDKSSPNGALSACALSPNGRIVAVGGYDSEAGVYLFDKQTGQVTKRLSGLSGSVRRLQFTPDGEYLAAALSLGCIVWRCRDWSLVDVDKNVGDSSEGLDFARSDGAWSMATSCLDGKIRYYRLGDNLEKICEYTMDSGGPPQGLSFSPDGRFLAVARDYSVEVLSVTANQISLSFKPDIAADALYVHSVRFSQDGTYLYASFLHNGEMVRMWSKAGRGTYRDLKTRARFVLGDLESIPDGELLIGGPDPYWAILNASGTARISMGAPILNFNSGGPLFRLGPQRPGSGFFPLAFRHYLPHPFPQLPPKLPASWLEPPRLVQP